MVAPIPFYIDIIFSGTKSSFSIKVTLKISEHIIAYLDLASL